MNKRAKFKDLENIIEIRQKLVIGKIKNKEDFNKILARLLIYAPRYRKIHAVIDDSFTIEDLITMARILTIFKAGCVDKGDRNIIIHYSGSFPIKELPYFKNFQFDKSSYITLAYTWDKLVTIDINTYQMEYIDCSHLYPKYVR